MDRYSSKEQRQKDCEYKAILGYMARPCSGLGEVESSAFRVFVGLFSL